jgi:hypothetical protein
VGGPLRKASSNRIGQSLNKDDPNKPVLIMIIIGVTLPCAYDSEHTYYALSAYDFQSLSSFGWHFS